MKRAHSKVDDHQSTRNMNALHSRKHDFIQERSPALLIRQKEYTADMDSVGLIIGKKEMDHLVKTSSKYNIEDEATVHDIVGEYIVNNMEKSQKITIDDGEEEVVEYSEEKVF